MLYEENFTPEQRLGIAREGFRLEADCLEKYLGRGVSRKPLQRLEQLSGLTIEQAEELCKEFFTLSLDQSDESASWELASDVLSRFLKPSWA